MPADIYLFVSEAALNSRGQPDPRAWHYRPGDPVPDYMTLIPVPVFGYGFTGEELRTACPRLYYGESRLVEIPHPETGAPTAWRFEIDSESGNVLGPVGKDYYAIGYKPLYDLIDEVGLRMTTTMRLGEVGETWLACTPLGSFNVRRLDGGDDPVETYLQWWKQAAGRSAIHVDASGIRTVCANTMRWAIQTATLRVRIPHTESWESRLREAVSAIRTLRENLPVVERTCNAMEQVPCTVDELVAMTRDILGAATREERARKATVADLAAGDRVQTDGERTKRADTIRARKTEQIEELFLHGAGNRGRSWWDAFNAITDYADHHAPVRGCGGDPDAQARRRYVNSVLDNTRIKQDALDFILENTRVRELAFAA